eukprot:12708610-Alexandrium_andersonii.AAC.1
MEPKYIVRQRTARAPPMDVLHSGPLPRKQAVAVEAKAASTASASEAAMLPPVAVPMRGRSEDRQGGAADP